MKNYEHLAVIVQISIIGAGFIATCATLHSFDLLLKIMYERVKEQWLEKGSPAGFFWLPKDSDWLASWVPRQKLIMEFTFQRPKWVEASKEATKARRKFLIWYGMTCLIIATGMIHMAVYLPPKK